MTENTVESILAEKGEYVATTAGGSMAPLLRDRQYAVRIVPAKGRLKKYDVALFRRGEKLVLHRVIKVKKDGYYIRGDHDDEGEYVADGQIVGVLAEVIGRDKTVKMTDTSYKLYSRLTVLLSPVRRLSRKIRRFIRHRLPKGN